MREGPAKIVVHVAALCLASLTFAMAGATIPVVGVFFALLTPLPLVLLSMRPGRAIGICGMLVVGGSLALLVGRGYAIIFFLEFCLPAIMLAEALRREWAPERSVAAGSLALIGGTLLGVLVLSKGEGGLTRNLLEHLDLAVQETMALYGKIGLSPDEVGALSASVRQVRQFLLAASPGLFLAATLLTVSANYFLARAALTRASGATAFNPEFAWKMPDPLVWVFIGSATLFLSGLPIAKDIGLNGLLVMMALYFLQGLAIAAFWIRRLRLPPFIGILGVVLCLLQPLLLLVVTGVGLFDIWVTFRRETLQGPPGT